MLRLLRKEDAPFMLEWMHDSDVGGRLAADFEHMTEADCERFIEKSVTEEENLHRAVCSEEDEYLGTISLKNINKKSLHAEYAICMRSKAIGTGAAKEATKEILELAFGTLGLRKVYLCVYSENMRAIRFYEKMGFVYEGTFRQHTVSKEEPEKFHDLMWFSILKSEYENTKR